MVSGQLFKLPSLGPSQTSPGSRPLLQAAVLSFTARLGSTEVGFDWRVMNLILLSLQTHFSPWTEIPVASL